MFYVVDQNGQYINEFNTQKQAQKYCDKKNELINFVKKSNISYISLFKKK